MAAASGRSSSGDVRDRFDASTVPVRDVAKGLARLQKAGGRIAVQVADGF
jgi:hypothetical protein